MFWPGCRLVYECPLLQVGIIHKVSFSYAIGLSSHYSLIEQRTHMGIIFARWHLAMAITSVPCCPAAFPRTEAT